PDNEDTDLEPERLDEQIARLNEVLTEDNRELLQSFWQSKMVVNLSEEARERLDDAYPVIVHALLAHQEQQKLANAALPRLISLLEAICRRS
ncbi:hypothetical protein SB761_29350, partial [Pseudomonas sp. SIMBA_064]